MMRILTVGVRAGINLQENGLTIFFFARRDLGKRNYCTSWHRLEVPIRDRLVAVVNGAGPAVWNVVEEGPQRWNGIGPNPGNQRAEEGKLGKIEFPV